jgi:hypothetical protein
MCVVIKNAPENVILKIMFKHEGLALMHKVWRQIFINNVLVGCLRIKECNMGIRNMIITIKATAAEKLLVKYIKRSGTNDSKKGSGKKKKGKSK